LPAESTNGLIANKHYGTLRSGDIVGEVVLYSAAGAHTGAGYN
jgi:hypothetical protein